MEGGFSSYLTTKKADSSHRKERTGILYIFYFVVKVEIQIIIIFF